MFCIKHGGIPHKRCVLRDKKGKKRKWLRPTVKCNCNKYKYPHRIGSGKCIARAHTHSEDEAQDNTPAYEPVERRKRTGFW